MQIDVNLILIESVLFWIIFNVCYTMQNNRKQTNETPFFFSFVFYKCGGNEMFPAPKAHRIYSI